MVFSGFYAARISLSSQHKLTEVMWNELFQHHTDVKEQKHPKHNTKNIFIQTYRG